MLVLQHFQGPNQGEVAQGHQLPAEIILILSVVEEVKFIVEIITIRIVVVVVVLSRARTL